MTQLASGPLVTSQPQQQWAFRQVLDSPGCNGIGPAIRTVLERPFDGKEIRHDMKRHTDGFEPTYVEAHSVIQRLNDAFNGAWSFEVIDHTLAPTADPVQVVVHGRITVGYYHKSPDGNASYEWRTILKEQYGSCFLKKKQGIGYVDIGSDFKAAATDALKKCATQLGIALDLYTRDETAMQGMSRTGDISNQGTFPAQQANMSAPAEDWQVNQIQSLFAKFGVNDQTWKTTLGLTSREQLTQGLVQSILSGQHSWIQQLHQAAGTAPGLKHTVA